MFHGTNKLTGQSVYDASKVDGTIKWKFKADGGVETSPVIGIDGTIYFIDHKCNLYAVDQNGSQKWKFSGGKPIFTKEWNNWSCAHSTPAIAKDGTIYALMMTGSFFAVNPDGTEKWRAPVFAFNDGWSSPVIASDGTIYVSSEIYPPRETGKEMEKPGYVYAFNPDGTKKWERTNGSAGGSNSVAAIADDGTVYLGTSESRENDHPFEMKLFAFNPDGSTKWSFWPDNGVIEGSPAIGKDGTIYFGTKGKDDPRNANFYALNPDGTEQWRVPLSQGESITPAIANDGTIYFGDWGGTFYAYDAQGKEKWRVQIPESESVYESLSSSPAISADGTLYFGSTMGLFFAYSKDGEEKWRSKIEGGGIVASPAIGADGTVYVTTVPGELLAFGPNKGVSASSSSATGKKELGFMSKYLLTIGLATTYLLGTILIFYLVIFLLRKKLSGKLLSVYEFSKNHKIIICVIFLIFAGSLGGSSYMFFINTKKVSTPAASQEKDNTTHISCPKNVYQRGENAYYAVYWENNKAVQKDISVKEHEQIKSSCKNTTLPEAQNQGQNTNTPQTDTGNSENDKCPHHIYGTWENGFYGAYGGRTTKDLTNDESKWIQQNCPNTTWPEQYRNDKK